jgi:pyruvate/2-oxoglutarate dehydrogenase complex dihydrolipoamide dehydrogenase (E3) component
MAQRRPIRHDGVLSADLCIIGAGSGGLTVAAGAAQMGASVILIEAGEMGGDCLNTGCVPSKALLAAAKRRLAFPQAMAQVRAAIATITPHDSEARFTSLGCTVIRAHARFTSPEEVMAGGERIRARRFILATGSRATVPPVPGLDAVPFLTHETLFQLAEQPAHLAILGGGPIGCEMAQAFARLGSRVTLIEGDRLLAREDAEAVEVVRAALAADGVTLIEGAEVTAIHPGPVLQTSAGRVAATHLLIATGRRPVLEGLGLEEAGIETTPRGIALTDGLATTNHRVLAVGDVAGLGQFTHLAGFQGGSAIRRALFGLGAPALPAALPRVTYTEPELAQIGPTEAEAPGATVQKVALTQNDRAIAEGQTAGFAKLIIGRRGRILGATIVAPHAGEQAGLWVLAISQRLPVTKVAGLVLPYPTLAEAGKRAAGQHLAPRQFGPLMRRLVGLTQRFLP